MSPPITKSVEKVETPVTLTPPAPTVNPPTPNVKLELSCKAPEVPARTTLPDVKSLTVADENTLSPPETSIPPLASINPVKVDIPPTDKFVFKPTCPLAVNPPFATTNPVNVETPVTAKPLFTTT